MERKALDVTSMEDIKERVTDVEVFGDPGDWELICKASSKAQGWMRSTKAMEIKSGGPLGTVFGCLVQVSTHQEQTTGSANIAEAVIWVPGVMITREGTSDGEIVSRKLVQADDVYSVAAKEASDKAFREAVLPTDGNRMSSKR